jgi:hypothetical protein
MKDVVNVLFTFTYWFDQCKRASKNMSYPDAMVTKGRCKKTFSCLWFQLHDLNIIHVVSFWIDAWMWTVAASGNNQLPCPLFYPKKINIQMCLFPIKDPLRARSLQWLNIWVQCVMYSIHTIQCNNAPVYCIYNI